MPRIISENAERSHIEHEALTRDDGEAKPPCGQHGSENRLPANYGAGASGVDDLCAVLDAEGLDKINLFGHSARGVTAFVFACRFPDRVERLVLIEPTLLPILLAEERAAVMASHEAIAAARALLASVGGEAWTSLDAENQAKRLG
jgi:pimeloyl-ACP methyl ester carboxylesterase